MKSVAPLLLLALVLAGLSASTTTVVDGAGASPHAFTEIQPDGTATPPLRVLGGPRSHRIVTVEGGYAVLRDDATGEWRYAAPDGGKGRLKPSGAVVGRDAPSETDFVRLSDAAVAKFGDRKRTSLRERPCASSVNHDDCSFGVANQTASARYGNVEHTHSLRGRWRAPSSANATHSVADDDSSAATDDHRRRNLLRLATGSMKNLCILIRFADHKSRTLPTVHDIDALMNRLGGDPTLAPSGSVRDVYRASSYDTFDLVTTVVGWITLPKTEAYYAGGKSGSRGAPFTDALRYALDKLDAIPSFSLKDFDKDGDGTLDAVMFLHSGYGAEWGKTDCDDQVAENRIWSHKQELKPTWTSRGGQYVVSTYHTSPSLWGWCGTELSRIGTIAHETGHSLGLPDLYLGGHGIGSYGLMGNSWGFSASQFYPPTMCPWSKIKLGWMTPTLADTGGTYTLEASADTPQVLKITRGFPFDEYLLIENRQPIGFDAKMPQGGLAIWHIDERASFGDEPGYPDQEGWPRNGKHNRVALLQSDGLYDLERGVNRGDGSDVWHAGSVKTELGPSETKKLLFGSGGPYPNTDSYQKGQQAAPTGLKIYDISESGRSMSFRLDWDDGEGDASVAKVSPSFDQVLQEETEIGTAFNGGYVNFGSMFDIVAGPKPVTLLSLDIHTRFKGPGGKVKVYTKVGSLSGSERLEKNWSLLCDSTKMVGRGVTKRTPIPTDDCKTPITISAGRTQGFYVTMETKDLVYSPGTTFLGELAANTDVAILEGTGVGGSHFGPSYKPRPVNCFVRYRIDNGVRPALSLVKKGKGGPIPEEKKLGTKFDGETQSFGSMFNVRAKSEVKITSLYIHITAKAGETIPVEVYTKEGVYHSHEKSPGAWTRICATNVVSRGSGKPTEIPAAAFDDVMITSDQVQAFYVTTKTPGISYTKGAFPVSNEHVTIEGGAGVGGYPFGARGNVFQPRAANVVLKYEKSS